eukprot:scaffold4554_cov28-Prasinocladus_malaysianus.AAC.1
MVPSPHPPTADSTRTGTQIPLNPHLMAAAGGTVLYGSPRTPHSARSPPHSAVRRSPQSAPG